MLAILDGNSIKTKDALHDALSRSLSLPEWYGRNLDALYDCLTDLHENTEILLLHAEALENSLGEYARQFQCVLNDAAADQPCVKFTRIAR